MKFIDKVITRLEKSNSALCVGLDSRFDRIPDSIKDGQTIAAAIFEFNKHIVDATHNHAGAFKMNVSFYAGFGAEGLEGLRLTNRYIRESYPDIPLLADCKRSEMGESVKMVRQEIFEDLGFDCVMVTPWFGFDTVKDYLDNEAHGVIVYVHDSNPTAAEFQDLELKNGKKLYEYVTERVAHNWNTNGNVFVEAGLTYPNELKKVREIVGQDMPILTAGLGAQNGDPQNLTGLFGTNSKRLLVNVSRGIIFSGEGKDDYFESVAKAAADYRSLLQDLSGK